MNNGKIEIMGTDILALEDEGRRKEFAKAFNWRKPKQQYDYGEGDLRIPTWIEIYVEVGKLLERQNNLNAFQDMEQLRADIRNLDYKMKMKGKPESDLIDS